MFKLLTGVSLYLCIVFCLSTLAELAVDWNLAIPNAPWGEREGHSSVVYNGRMWIIGSRPDLMSAGYPEAERNDVWSSEDGQRWVREAESAAWARRVHHSSVVHHEKMWVIGGHSCPQEERDWLAYSDVWCSSDGLSWIQVTDSAPWPARGMHSSVVYDDKIWVIGGFPWPPEWYVWIMYPLPSQWHTENRRIQCKTVSDLIESSDVWHSADGAHWERTTGSAPWGPRAGHSTVVYEDKIWILGGVRATGASDENLLAEDNLNDVWYSADGINWSQATDSAPWDRRFNHTSVIFDDKMWVIGGIFYEITHYSPTSTYLRWCVYEDVWYSDDGENWTNAILGSGHRYGERTNHTSIVYDGKIWCLGGSDRIIDRIDVCYSTLLFAGRNLFLLDGFGNVHIGTIAD